MVSLVVSLFLSFFLTLTSSYRSTDCLSVFVSNLPYSLLESLNLSFGTDISKYKLDKE